MGRLHRLIEQRPAVLDGGLATELERRGHDLRHRLWSARMLRDDPRSVLAVHADFAAVGADVLGTATYQASVDGFVKAGVRPSQAWRLIAGSVALARGGAESVGRDDVLVAGSCGPLAATFADAAEYRGYAGGVPHRRLADFHRERAHVLLDAGVDVLAFETIPSLDEVRAIVEVLDDLRPPAAWITLTTPDGAHTAEGDPLDDVPGITAGSGALLGVNCCAPDHVASALEHLRAGPRSPAVVYPNLGASYDPDRGRWIRTATALSGLIDAWSARGARLVGGCCGTRPDDVRRIARHLRRTDRDR